MAYWGGIDDYLVFRSFVDEATYVDVDINGNTADAAASADAYGDDTFTAALTASYTDDNESHSESVSLSATDDEHRRHDRHHKYY